MLPIPKHRRASTLSAPPDSPARPRLIWTVLYTAVGAALLVAGFTEREWGLAVVGASYVAAVPWIMRQIINVRVLSLLVALGGGWYAHGLHEGDAVRSAAGLVLALMAAGAIGTHVYRERRET